MWFGFQFAMGVIAALATLYLAVIIVMAVGFFVKANARLLGVLLGVVAWGFLAWRLIVGLR